LFLWLCIGFCVCVSLVVGLCLFFFVVVVVGGWWGVVGGGGGGQISPSWW